MADFVADIDLWPISSSMWPIWFEADIDVIRGNMYNLLCYQIVVVGAAKVQNFAIPLPYIGTHRITTSGNRIRQRGVISLGRFLVTVYVPQWCEGRRLKDVLRAQWSNKKNFRFRLWASYKPTPSLRKISYKYGTLV